MLNAVFLALAMLLLWIGNRDEERSVGHWLAGAVLLAVGMLAIAVRGSVSDLISVPLANAALLGASAFFVSGIAQFVRRPIGLWMPGAVMLAAALLFAGLVQGGASIAVRIVIFSGLVSALAGWSAWLLWRHVDPGMHLEQKFTAVVFALHGSFMLIRAVLTAGTSVPDLLAGGTMQAAAFIDSLVLSIALMLGFGAMLTRRLHEHLGKQAHFDLVTDLLNRRALESVALKEARRSWRRRYAVAVLMIDLDHFKKINDRYGHAGGDAVLKAFGIVCQKVFRQDDYVGRYGGDEFCVVLPYADATKTRQIAERARVAVMSLRIPCKGETIIPTVSIGASMIVATGNPESDWKSALARADEALYEAKNAGRNQVVVIEPKEIPVPPAADIITESNPTSDFLKSISEALRSN